MHKLFSSLIAIFLFVSTGYAQKPGKVVQLNATEFAQKINQSPDAVIVDVRTPGEFSKGHLENALNIDWKGKGFVEKIAKVEKAKPVFVYCFSGGRSSAAVAEMQSLGFTKIYELSGGMMKWRAAKLPETGTGIAQGMSVQQFESHLDSKKLVLVDFYADWCAPCKKMEPYLNEIAAEQKSTVKVVRINADENRLLCNKLQVDALPVLHLYKDGQLIWNHTGYIGKKEVLEQLQ